MTKDTYTGRCHCGAVRFEANVDLDSTVMCNCSLCSLRGFRWAFIPRDDFHLERGAEQLAEYRFHEHVIDHRFCKTCGIEPFAFSEPEGRPMAMIDVRCLEGVDVSTLPPPVHYDGRSR